VEAALAAGFPSVKVNAVLLRDMGDEELDRFLSWTRQAPLTVRFIELMETADNQALFQGCRLPAAEVRARLLRLGWKQLPRDPIDGPAVSYAHGAHAGRVGLISAYAHGFCDSCNRLRVGSAGDLRLCLFGDRTVPLRPLLADDSQRAALEERIASAVAHKPAAHSLAAGACGSASNLAVTGG
jgi:cyclic pyranopterin phosphate synthase